jgi:hypothetical protein
MPIKPEDFDILMRHMRMKFGSATFITKCPVCHHAAGWFADGPFASLGYTEVSQGPAQIGGEAYPVMTLTCKNCAYSMPFGWLQMRAGLTGGS